MQKEEEKVTTTQNGVVSEYLSQSGDDDSVNFHVDYSDHSQSACC